MLLRGAHPITLLLRLLAHHIYAKSKCNTVKRFSQWWLAFIRCIHCIFVFQCVLTSISFETDFTKKENYKRFLALEKSSLAFSMADLYLRNKNPSCQAVK